MDKSNNITLKKQWFITSRPGTIDDYYTTTSKKTLGQGTYGSVIKVRSKDSKEILRAIKIIPKNKVKDPSKFQNEIEIMKTLDHPNIIKLYENYEDQRNVYLVMELCEGGELFDRIIEKGHFSEKQARTIFSQIVQAVSYCHANKICHRDLKPENFLLLNKNDDSPIKVIDFGLSHLFGKDPNDKIKMKTRAGTPYYISPEVLEGSYDESCDVWSLGVILFILLSGLPPFYGKDDKEILNMVRSRKFSFDIPEFSKVSESAKDLIRRCLTTVDKRIKAHEILETQWMKQDLPNVVLTLNFDKLKSFNGHEKLKKVALTYIASQCSESEIKELGDLFKSIDKNNDGQLTVEEIQQGIKGLNSSQAKELESILKSIDTDGSGTIQYTEFIAATMDRNLYLKEEKLFQAFKMLDLDKSGKISKSELKQVLGKELGTGTKEKDESFWDSMIKEADANGDGEIDYNEFCDMMSQGKLNF